MISESSLTTGEMGGDIEGVSIEKRNVRVLPPSATYAKMENFICSLEKNYFVHIHPTRQVFACGTQVLKCL